MPNIPARSFLLLLSATLWGCAASLPAPEVPHDLADPDIVRRRIAARIRVVGSVLDEAGRPVPGATVHVEAHPRPRCVGGRGAIGDARVRADGWFIRTLYFYSLPATPSCLTFLVQPPAGSRLQPDSLGDVSSEFRHGAAIDTVIVHFRLRRSHLPR